MVRRGLTEDHMHMMRIPNRFWDSSLHLISDVGDLSPRRAVSSYAKKHLKMAERGAGLLFWGKNGHGKTSAMVVLAKELRRLGYSVLFYESASLKSDKIDNAMFNETISVWDRAKTVDILCLDDLGKGTQDSTGFGSRLLDELLRFRYSRLLPTFITTNMPPSKLGEELKISTLHTLKEYVLPVKVEGRDFREERKADLLNILMKD